MRSGGSFSHMAVSKYVNRNGEEEYSEEVAEVDNDTGYIRRNKNGEVYQRDLTPAEIASIRSKQFMPNLFIDLCKNDECRVLDITPSPRKTQKKRGRPRKRPPTPAATSATNIDGLTVVPSSIMDMMNNIDESEWTRIPTMKITPPKKSARLTRKMKNLKKMNEDLVVPAPIMVVDKLN